MEIFMTNITGYDNNEAKIHFLHSISQMNNTAVLLRQRDDGQLEAIHVSKPFADMMECSVEEATRIMDGTGIIDTTHPDDRALVDSMLKARTADDGTSELTIQKITAKGNRIWCKVNYSFIDDFGEHYIYCTYSNVTLLKEYEERLKSVYISLGNNFYQINDQTLALFRVNLTRNIIEETSGRDLFDTDSTSIPYSEAMAKRAESFPIRDERDAFLAVFDKNTLIKGYSEGKVFANLVLYSKRADGRNCFVEFAATLTRHPITGDIVAFITEQECNSDKVKKTLMQKILARQFDMVAYLVNGNYGVTIGDASSIKRGSIFPKTPSGNYRQYLEQQIFPVLNGTAEYIEATKRALSLEQIEMMTNQNKEPYVVNIDIEIDGEIYHKRLDFYSVDPNASFYVLLKSDTTELHREQAERNEQLRSALEEAKQANVAKTAFLSSMSHEIRTPMNAIIGIDSIALRDPDISPRTREYLENIGVSARHLLSLINDILDMSRIESGRMILKNEEFSFRGFLEQINTLISSQCEDKGLKYVCSVNGFVDEYYIGDDMKLKQVLINILGNAVKFTPSSGTVSFRVERAAQFEEQSTIRFTITDTGIGMDEEFIPTLFDAFTQEDNTITNSYGGSGLGLAITKNIVEMMNGNISVTSKKGEGSQFVVNVTLKNRERAGYNEAEDFNPGEMRVLVIDDDPIACEHAKLVLEEIGIAAETCLSGAKGLEMIKLHHARREDYNLILVDLRMPEQDGVEVARQIRGIVGDESAIIILTAYSWDDVRNEAIKAGVDSFMSKPLFASSVMEEFKQALQRKNLNNPQSGRRVSLKGRRILLVEDMMINAEIMKELLKMRDMEVEHAKNGKLAVDMFTEHPINYYDAVLMDVRMPVMDGLAATEAIRCVDREDAKTIPIIAMTANAFDEDVQRSLQAGMNAHLSKPVEPDHLFETLSGFIR